MALPTIPLREKVLLWLAHVEQRFREEPGLHTTQAGIANATGLARAYVSRTLAPLIEGGSVVQEERRVPGFGRRLVGYQLTDEGRKQTEQITRTLASVSVPTVRAGSQPTPMVLGEAISKSKPSKTLWEAILEIEKQGFLDLEGGGPSVASRTTYLRETADATAPPYFVGREREKAEFARWLEGNSRVCVLEAAAGFGKSAFLAHAIRVLNPRSHILWVRVSDWLASRILVERLDRLLRSLGRPDPPLRGESPAEFLEALRPRVKGFPILIVLDDYHRANDTLRDYVRALIELGTEEAKMKLVLAGREVPTPPEATKGLVRIALPPLSDSEGETLMARMEVPLDRRQKTIRAAAGNPLFLELLASHSDPARGQGNVARFLVRDIVGNLRTEDQEILRWISVHRFPLSPDNFRSLEIGSPASLDGLVHAGLLQRRDDGRYESHEFVRDAVYESLGFQERRRIHEVLANFYRHRTLTLDGAAQYLHHLVRAGQREAAVRWIFQNRTRILTQAQESFAGVTPG